MTQKHSRFFGIVQAGYRKLLTRITQSSEPTSIDVQGSDSDGIAERPRTPTMNSRVSSFKSSFSAEPGENDENGSPFLNQFTTVSKSYGKSLAYPTSPMKFRVPQPVRPSSPTLDLHQSKTEDYRMEMQPAIQAPSSPTTLKPGTTQPQALTALTGGESDSPGGIAGRVKSPDIAPLSVNPSPSRGSRSSKRLREDRGGSLKTHEQPGSGSTPNKRKKV
jgi:hypothetical protein